MGFCDNQCFVGSLAFESKCGLEPFRIVNRGVNNERGRFEGLFCFNHREAHQNSVTSLPSTQYAYFFSSAI